ncbi:MAG: SUMF1/EgtB/PvdO family nonheme iron enzyme [Elusimicrobiota bacterium]|nr:SUMF1/EgtB/PvdO family nonheme iron enzyme [Elusimicrobiota bacterium]
MKEKYGTSTTVEIPGMVYIPEGEFIIGTNDGFAYELPARKIYLPGFYIDRYGVTNIQYKKFIDATDYPAPKHWKNGNFPKGQENYPVTNVSYYDALQFARWSGKRLPTEEEWEKAARFTDGRIYPWGNEWNKKYANVRPLFGIPSLKPVGSYPEGCSPYGVYDTCGNVWEWTTSWFQAYPGNTTPDANFGEKFKVIRGGSYRQSEVISQTMRRDFLLPDSTRIDIGFRCAK